MIRLTFVFVLLSFTAQGFDHEHKLYNNVLKANVKNNMVDYAGLKNNLKELNQYLEALAKVPKKRFKTWNTRQQLAFLFNLYNAATLMLILKHYPVKSIRDISNPLKKGPWDQPVVRLFGKTITLNALEHQILRKEYNAPRLHLALVCAAKGCPPLRSEAYVGERLNQQLDDQSQRFLKNRMNFRIDKKKGVVYFSSIFNWYGKDFISKYSPKAGFKKLNEVEKATANFCAQYLSKEDRIYLESKEYQIKYLDYDWSLNEIKKKE